MAISKTPESEANRKGEFTSLYAACEPWLYSYLLTLLRHSEDANEVLQETAQLCWEKFDQYRPGTEFRAWACRIAHFKALKHRQRRQRSPAPFSDILFEALDEEIVVMTDVLDARLTYLHDCMQKLPSVDRRLIALRYTSGQTVAAIAEKTGRSTAAVYRALVRIHDALFRCVDLAMKGSSPR